MLFEALAPPRGRVQFLAYNKPNVQRFRNQVIYLSNVDLQERDGAVMFAVRVIPRASKSEIVGEQNGALKVRLKSPPVDGAANDELIRLLSREFGVARSQVDIVSGQTSKQKRIRINGFDRAAVGPVLKAKT